MSTFQSEYLMLKQVLKNMTERSRGGGFREVDGQLYDLQHLKDVAVAQILLYWAVFSFCQSP